MTTKKAMKTVFGVQWIEVEFGERDEGFLLHLDREASIKSAREASEKGAYAGGGGYCGPERPIRVYEIPFDSLEKDLRAKLKKSGFALTDNHWKPKFKDSGTVIR
jgi:hypothetical protein